MKVIIISDTHDKSHHIQYFLEKEKGNFDALIHCGDLVEATTLELFRGHEYPIYYVFGNNEGDTEGVIQKCQELDIHCFLDVGEFEIGGRSIAISHYPRVAETLVAYGDHDAVFFGHTHYAYKKQASSGRWLVSPGEMEGRNGDPTYALYDTQKNSVVIKQLEYRKKHYHFED